MTASTQTYALDLPDLNGRRIIVTGANRGIGFETATALAKAGAEVVLAVRNMDHGHAAAGQIGGRVYALPLDLSDLTSVARFTLRVASRFMAQSSAEAALSLLVAASPALPGAARPQATRSRPRSSGTV